MGFRDRDAAVDQPRPILVVLSPRLSPQTPTPPPSPYLAYLTLTFSSVSLPGSPVSCPPRSLTAQLHEGVVPKGGQGEAEGERGGGGQGACGGCGSRHEMRRDVMISLQRFAGSLTLAFARSKAALEVRSVRFPPGLRVLLSPLGLRSRRHDKVYSSTIIKPEVSHGRFNLTLSLPSLLQKYEQPI